VLTPAGRRERSRLAGRIRDWVVVVLLVVALRLGGLLKGAIVGGFEKPWWLVRGKLWVFEN